MTLQTKFWFRADAVMSASSKEEAWQKLSKLALIEAEQGHRSTNAFLAGDMSMQQNGHHLAGPVDLTGPAEEALVALYHKKVIEQGEQLALDELPDPAYSMMIGFAIAHDLSAADAKKLAQRLYRGQADAGDQRAGG